MQRPIVYPFLVTALKTTKLMTISSADLRDVLATFHVADADSLCECLRADHKMSIETLKPRRGRAAPTAVRAERRRRRNRGADRRVNGGDTSAAGAELELAELKGKLGAFEEQLLVLLDARVAAGADVDAAGDEEPAGRPREGERENGA